MRYCASCGAPIKAHTQVPLPTATIAALHREARSPADARRLVRGASRRCPIGIHRVEGGMPVYRVERDAEPVGTAELAEAA